MPRFMLDTNIASIIVKGRNHAVRDRLRSLRPSDLTISTITEAELLFGLERKPEAKTLAQSVRFFLLRVDILAWDSAAARSYAGLRARLEKAGRALGAADMMIVAHALAVGATLVSNDGALKRLGGLSPVVDWSVS